MLLKSVLATAVAVLSVAPEVHATFGTFGRWGCDYNILSFKARKICTIKNAFGCNVPAFGGICSSERTRVPPPAHIICPNGWYKHFEQDCCIPVHVDQECECPDSHEWDNQKWRCMPKRSQCQPGFFWHNKLGCCPEVNPPTGPCPDGHCPDGWYYNVRQRKCFPYRPDCPPPQCVGWNWNDCVCRPPKPSGRYNRWSRATPLAKKSQAAFPLSSTDEANCPANLHSCPITGLEGETAYECVDFATELESCGGCASTGAGVDCTAIPNADSVGCEGGVCKVYSCNSGYGVINGTCASL